MSGTLPGRTLRRMLGASEDPSPEALAAAARANLMALNLSLRDSRETTVFEDGGYFRWSVRVPHKFYNGVVCSADPDEGAADLVASTIESFEREAVPEFVWWPASARLAQAWTPALAARGFRLYDDLPGMAANLASLRVPDRLDALDIRLVESDAQLRTWSDTFVRGNGWPPEWTTPFFRMYRDLISPAGRHRCYLLYDGGEPVATSSVFFAEGVAGIYDVATLSSMRGRGFGGAVTVAPLLAAGAEGYRVGVLQSSTLGLRVYERLGFRTVVFLEYFTRP